MQDDQPTASGATHAGTRATASIIGRVNGAHVGMLRACPDA